MKENKPAIIASILLTVFLVISIWLIMQYVATVKQRDLQSWQDRLTVLAESQKRSVESWLDGQLENLQEVASNPLLQIYLSLGEWDETEMSEVQRGQAAHLRNLIVSAASHSGAFTKTVPISSNKKNTLLEGMGVVNSGGQLLISTRYFPVDEKEISIAVSRAMQVGGSVTHGIYSNENHEPRLILVVPVRAIQAGRDSETHPGAVVAVINPELSLFKILTQNWLTTSTDETLLIKGSGSGATYISPLTSGHNIFHQVEMSRGNQAINFALNNIGGFAVKDDYSGVDVLVTARRIDKTDWIMVQKIDANEALRESRAFQDFVLTVFLLAVFIITVTFIAIWKHSTSLRLQKARDRLSARTELLIAVSDNITDPIFLLDNNNNFVFVNKALSSCIKASIEEVRGMAINHVFDSEASEQLLKLHRDEVVVTNHVMELTIADCRATAHVTVVGLSQGRYKDSTLYVLHDITSLKEAQDRHNRLLEGIIATLVHATDMHDPHCANHSERTREVAVAIATAMELPEERINMLAMAALLANIGKLYLPREMLTKMEKLTDEEEAILRNNVAATVEILKDLEFDGPVIKFIEQKNEYLDGSGYPAGIVGDDILRESRILSVANAFVAMSSARAYRAGKPVEEVLDILLKQVDTHYDRHIVAALFHVAENRSDWSTWQNVRE